MGVCGLRSVDSPQCCNGFLAVYAVHARNDVLGRCMGQYSTTPTISVFNAAETFGVGEAHAPQLSAT